MDEAPETTFEMSILSKNLVFSSAGLQTGALMGVIDDILAVVAFVFNAFAVF